MQRFPSWFQQCDTDCSSSPFRELSKRAKTFMFKAHSNYMKVEHAEHGRNPIIRDFHTSLRISTFSEASPALALLLLNFPFDAGEESI